MAKPIEIKKINEFILFTKWNDEFESSIKMEDLRKECPCAECTGEKIGDKIYSRPKPVKFEPGVFDLTDIRPVGHYAINLVWKNGHDTGIYNWQLLRKIFEKFKLSEEEISEITQEKKKDKRNITLNVMNWLLILS